MARLLSLALIPALSSLALADGSGVAPLYDGFDDGTNQGGWFYNPGDVIESTGGNPGGWLHQPVADTFGPIFTSTADNFTGDFRAAGVDLLDFDARLDGLQFGDGSGFEMCLLLRDTKGTPDVGDDDYAYFVGPNIPLKGAGWKHFDFAIPSQSVEPVPAGWTGGWVGDPTSFRPGIDWNDVITSVDRVEIHWLNPAFFAIFQQWNVGHDNIAFHAGGSSVVRNGGGGNPLGFAETTPAELGGSWATTVDVATPGHPFSVVAIGTGGPAEGLFPGGAIVGELLVQPSFLVDVQAGAHSIPVPSDLSFLGACIYAQGATVAPSGAIHLNNALDVTIGG